MNQANSSAAEGLSVDIATRTWSESLPALIAVLADGTAEGRQIAGEQLKQMAAVADLCGMAIGTLARIAERGAAVDDDVGHIIERAKQSAPRSVDVDQPALPLEPADSQAIKPCGRLALRLSGKPLELQVCYSAAGFYLGTYDDDGPFTRESVEYWTRRELAVAALDSGGWTQREQP